MQKLATLITRDNIEDKSLQNVIHTSADLISQIASHLSQYDQNVANHKRFLLFLKFLLL